MRSRTIQLAVLALLALPLLVSPAPAQDFRLKPGAKGKKCLECHETFKETMALPHVHTPVKSGNCSDCHNPHSSSHAMLLDEDPTRICLGCHQDVVPEDARSVHAALVGGSCAVCHDPHAAENPNVLLESGNELCAGCHAEITEKAGQHKFKHHPVEDSCLNCHDPHAAADSDSLLSNAVPGLCVACHDASSTAFVAQHQGYRVGDSDCSSCHDPHGSDNGGILWANVHTPVANKMCKQCHNDASSAEALQTKSEKLDLCRGCHSQMVNETLTMNRVHGPLLDETSCMNCHAPHASAEPGLLAAPTIPLCGSCHADTIRRQEMSLTKHAPTEDGECSICHSPHASNTEFLLAGADQFEVCGTCHDWQEHSSHPIGADVLDPRNPNVSLDCSSCHRSHGTAFEYFSHAEPKRDLCILCHQEFRR